MRPRRKKKYNHHTSIVRPTHIHVQGNAQFKDNKFEAAIACYTRGLEADPSSAVLYANRAMAAINVKRYVDAETDCTACIKIDPSFVKVCM